MTAGLKGKPSIGPIRGLGYITAAGSDYFLLIAVVIDIEHLFVLFPEGLSE